MSYQEPIGSKMLFNIRKVLIIFGKLPHYIVKKAKYIKEYITPSYWKSKVEKMKNPTGYLEVVKEKVENKEQMKIDTSKKVAVYTCIFGNYDTIHEPFYKSKSCDYYIITDLELRKNSAWNQLDFNKPKGFNEWEPKTKNRYCKMHPHLLFPDYEYSIYIDGTLQPMADMAPFVNRLDGHIFGLFRHPIWDCAYRSIDILKQLRFDTPENFDRQVAYYRQQGFPDHFGYFECTMIVRKHKDSLCKKVMEEWWQEYLVFAKRDQTGFVYTLWKNGLTSSDVTCYGNNVRKDPRIKFIDHIHKCK